MDTNFPEDVLNLLKLREGYSTTVYLDTVGVKTAGIGHRLLPADLAEYPNVGSEVPEEVIMHWFSEDVGKAYTAALEQASDLHIADGHFIAVLTSVNFELGVNWRDKFVSTWHLLMTRQWAQAAKHIDSSLWARQAKVRAEDFAKAIESQIESPENGTSSIFAAPPTA